MKSITVFGPVNLDVSAGPVSFSALSSGSLPVENMLLSFGGDALNESVVLNRLGADVQLVSKVGCDQAGEQILRFLAAEGLSLHSIRQCPDWPTSINIVLVDPDGERYFLTSPKGSMRHMTSGDYMPDLPDAANLVCFPGMFVSPQLTIPSMETLFRAVKQKPGRILAVDMTKAKHGETLSDLSGLLPLVDYIFPNEAEIALLTGQPDPFRNARLLLDFGVRCAVIKRGKHGCLLANKQGIKEIPAYPVSKAIDTTGAGDAFTAGFLFALLQEMPPEDCALFANAVASCIVESFGSCRGLSSVELPMRRFREMKK